MNREKTDRLKTLLGSWREQRARPSVEIRGSVSTRDCVIEDLVVTAGTGEPLPALLCLPPKKSDPGPAVLYAHAHGNQHHIGRRELVEGRPALADPPYGPVLASRGYRVLCMDMPGFGGRTRRSEESRAKAGHWYGRTLMGEMLSDLALGIDLLVARDDVDKKRIGMLGLSMGATHAYWLAALDERIAAVAQICAFASLRSLVETGAHDLHGPYMTVPNFLSEFDSGTVAGLVAPRPQLVCVGLEDPLTPAPAFYRAWEEAAAAYRGAGAGQALQRVAETRGGHRESARMREAVLQFLDRHLDPERQAG